MDGFVSAQNLSSNKMMSRISSYRDCILSTKIVKNSIII